MSPVKHRFLLEVVGWCAKVAILVKLEKEKKNVVVWCWYSFWFSDLLSRDALSPKSEICKTLKAWRVYQRGPIPIRKSNSNRQFQEVLIVREYQKD
jgi:hypothetical protein